MIFQETDLSPTQFRTLRSATIGSYFVGPTLTDESGVESLSFDRDILARFHDDFERLLIHRKGMQGLSKASGFHDWWMQNHAIYLTRPVVETYVKEGLTLGELLDDMHLFYMAGQAKKQSLSRTARVLGRVTKRKIVFAVAFPLVVLAHKIIIFLWNLLVLGPGVQMMNSYTTPVITPLAQTATQIGSQDLAVVASSIQAWLTNREKLREVRQEIDETTQRLQHTDFKSMKPEQIRTKWAEFEQTYFGLFMRYNQTLPSHLRDGRSFFRDWMVFTPVGLSTNLAAFDTQYWTHRRELESLKAKERRSGLVAEEKRLAAIHRGQMQAAEGRIAATLAAWKIYEFMFPEFAQQPINANGKLELKDSYRILIKSMRFDLYVTQFASRVHEILRHMDAEFLMQDRISRAAASKK